MNFENGLVKSVPVFGLQRHSDRNLLKFQFFQLANRPKGPIGLKANFPSCKAGPLLKVLLSWEKMRWSKNGPVWPAGPQWDKSIKISGLAYRPQSNFSLI